VAELRGHQGPVRSAALSPDGRRVATTGEDGTVRVWPSNGQGEPRVFAAHRKPGRLVRFSSDGEHVVSSGEDGRTHVWRVEEPLPRTVLARAPSGTARFAAFSRDGVWALTLGQDGTPWIQHTDGQGQPVALPGRLTRLRSAVFDGDGQRLLTVGEDGQVLVWRTDGTRAPEPLPATEGGPLLSAVFSPEGPGVIGISQDGRVWRWPEGTGGPEALKGLQQHGPLGFAALSPDGQHVVAVDKDQRVRVLRTDGTTDDPTKHGLTEKVEAPPPFVVFSPDGKSVLVPYARGMARVWPLSGARDRSITYLRHEGRLVSAAFGTDGRRVLTVDEEGTVSVWRMEANGRRRGAPVVLRAPGALAATLDEAREDVLIRRKDGSLERWTLSSDRLVSLLEERVYGCLRPDDRMAYLAEKDSTARSKNDECKKVPGSTPRN
jgi:WD40 repeat protein